MVHIDLSPDLDHGALLDVGSVFRNRSFLLLWASQLLSQLASNMVLAALMATVVAATGSNTANAVLILTFLVPAVAFSAIAGVLVEPMLQGAGGMIVWPAEFLAGVRRLCDRHGVLLICDEVATGFGRTGTMFACEQEGVSPDILALAKGLTGGYLPLAATLTTEEIYRMFLGRYEEYKTFFHGHSYTANPLGCAAALGTLSIFEGEDMPARVSALSAIMAMSLSRLAGQPNVGDIRQKGLMAGIEIVADRKTKERFPPELRLGQKMVRKAREKGILLRPLGDVIVLMPPLSSTESEVEGLVDVTAWAIGEVLG